MWTVVVLTLGGCAQPASEPAPPPHVVTEPCAENPTDYAGLHNVVAFAPGLYSGSVPEGTSGFETLRALGVKTVVSVDGARPDVAAARSQGLRYVHLPIGYDGVGSKRTLEIARAIELGREQGAVYVHCHHGKHRSAGAAGAAAVTLGLLKPNRAKRLLEVAGTSPRYAGLYRSVAASHRISSAELAAIPAEFPEVWETSGLVQSMVAIDTSFDRLQRIERAGWTTPASHPDLVPAAEAGRITDVFRLLRDDGQVRTKPEELREWLGESMREASGIEEALASGAALDAADLSRRLANLGRSCKACHTKYRD